MINYQCIKMFKVWSLSTSPSFSKQPLTWQHINLNLLQHKPKQLSKSFLSDKVVACQFIPSGVSESQLKGGDVVPLDTASPPTRQSANLGSGCSFVSQRKRATRWLLNLSADVLSTKKPQHSKDALEHLYKRTHTHANTYPYLTIKVLDASAQISCYLCMHGQKHTRHTWSEKSKEEETLVLKRHWFIFRSARVRSCHVKRVLLLINEHTIKKKRLPSNLPVLRESFMQMEFKMRWSYLQRPWLFFHSPLLKFMPPLIYKFY